MFMLSTHEPSLNSLVKHAVARVVTDGVMADNVAVSVLAALEEYEDEALLAILENEPEDKPVDIAAVQSVLKS